MLTVAAEFENSKQFTLKAAVSFIAGGGERGVGVWTELYPGNSSLTSLRAAPNADGRLEVVGVDQQAHMWHTWHVQPNGSWVGNWSELYSDNDSLDNDNYDYYYAAARNADGRLELFAFTPSAPDSPGVAFGIPGRPRRTGAGWAAGVSYTAGATTQVAPALRSPRTPMGG